ncbi:MAG: nicotinate (nicotinamide) nucleotide adenylyltransferase [Alphaproteobacteria bacterium]|nr:nicotinate (nicotinamide) nucleotide adenylyltransferase [Alphaproteobacteria bacterium]
MSKKVTLLLGGSFNPIHQSGHIGSITHVYHTLNLEGATVHEAWLMPAAQNPFKSTKDMAPYEHRLAMCEIEAAKHPWLSVSDFEGQMPAPHYTHRVLSAMLESYPDRQFIWMMGSDNLDHFHEWEYYQEMIHMVPMVIMARDGSMERAMHSPTMREFAHCLKDSGAPFDGGNDIRYMITNCFAGAATEVRNAIKNGEKTSHISSGVRNHIDQYGLYR